MITIHERPGHSGHLELRCLSTDVEWTKAVDEKTWTGECPQRGLANMAKLDVLRVEGEDKRVRVFWHGQTLQCGTQRYWMDAQNGIEAYICLRP